MVLTQEEFKAVIKARGYTQAEAARLWGLTAARLTQIAQDSERSPAYEFALWGLPRERVAALVAARRAEGARRLVRDVKPASVAAAQSESPS